MSESSSPRFYRCSSSGKAAAGFSRLGFLRLFTTRRQNTRRLISHSKEARDLANTPAPTTASYGLNPDARLVATISTCNQHAKHLHLHQNGAPRVATRKHAPFAHQATLTSADHPGLCEDTRRDKSERPECAQRKRWQHGPAHDKAQTERM